MGNELPVDYIKICEEFRRLLKLLLECEVDFCTNSKPTIIKTRERKEGEVTTSQITYKGRFETISKRQCILTAVTQAIKPMGTNEPWIIDELTEVECVVDYAMTVRRYCAGWKSIHEHESRQIWVIERPATASTMGIHSTTGDEREGEVVAPEEMLSLKRIK